MVTSWGRSVAPACSAALDSALGDESLRRRYIRGWRRLPHNHIVDATSCPAGIRQGNPGSKYGGLVSARFRAGRRQTDCVASGLLYAGVFSTQGVPLLQVPNYCSSRGLVPQVGICDSTSY